MKKMKKDERHTYIRNQAYELARTGDYMDWLSIEWSLRNDGFGEARSILDNQRIRKELDEICEIAKSPEEIENRKSFKAWISEYLEPKINELKKEYPEIKFYSREDSFSISNSYNELEMKKVFSKKLLYSILRFDADDGRRYKIDSYHTTSKDFNDFTDEDVITLIKIVNTKH